MLCRRLVGEFCFINKDGGGLCVHVILRESVALTVIRSFFVINLIYFIASFLIFQIKLNISYQKHIFCI